MNEKGFAENRRRFLKSAVLGTASVCFGGVSCKKILAQESTNGFPRTGEMKFGLCTYRWGEKLPLNELLDVCHAAGIEGIELRCNHAHAVEPELDAAARSAVKKQFTDAHVTLVGFGTNEAFHYTDPTEVRRHIERAKEYVRLAADCGVSGVKVKPNDLPKEVEQSKTTAQIAEALDELGEYAAGFGQVIRLENHGGCAAIPIMKEIIEQVHAPNVGLCWNSNKVDLDAPGFEANLRSVLDRLADTAHVCGTPPERYPYADLCRVLNEAKWSGWILIENGQPIEDLLAGLKTTKAEFDAWMGK